MSEVFEQVMALCARGSFTGWLRVQTREGNGEVRFVSGIQDGARFDTLSGDDALARLESAGDPEFEAVAALPPIDKNSQTPVPIDGTLDRIHAATLMRYCESNSLTCALELEAEGKMLTARYRLGELLSVEPDSELTAQIAEAKQGVYRFKLPRFELPAGARVKAAPASTGTPGMAAAAARPAAPNVAAAFKPAAAPAVQPMRAAPAPHTRPTPAATPAAVRGIPSSAGSARTPAAPAASAARAAASPAAAASRPAASAAASPARPAVNAEPLRPAPIAEVRAAPVAEVRPVAARAPEPAPAPSPAPAAAARAPAASPVVERAPAPKAAPAAAVLPAAALPAVAQPAAARSQASSGEGRTANPARPAAARPQEQERPAPRYGLFVALALVAVALVVWVVLGAPLPVH